MAFIDFVISGLIGTVAMTAIILMGPAMKILPKGYNMITDGLGGMLNNIMGVNKNMGWLVHIIIGGLIHPFLYTLIFPSGGIANGIIFALIFAVAMISMMFMNQMSIDADFRVMASVGIVIAHIVYGILLEVIGTNLAA